MEKFYLERPSLERKKDILEYFNEFVEYNSDINGSGSLDNVLTDMSFEEALERCLNTENEEYAKKINKCPAKTFLLIRKNDNKVVGMINVRWNLTPSMQQFGGHIGYAIRPTERRKGYNKINLYLGLVEAQKLGLKRVMLDCDCNNLGSDKTLKALGGILERTEIDPSDGILTNVYWFDVEECLEKYAEIYKPYILSNNKLESSMKIIEYNSKYLEDVRNLLVELEEYIVSIDKDNLDHVHPEYHEKMALLDLKEVSEQDGKCFLALEDDKVIGLIMGTIPLYDEYDYLDYKCPKRGEVTELIVSRETRSKGVGQQLMEKMEEYFKSKDCEYSMVDVFAYNENAIKFYEKKGYHARMYTDIKKL